VCQRIRNWPVSFACVERVNTNLKNVDVDIPRDASLVFTGVSGSGKSSLPFGTLYAEPQRRYLESVSPYTRRLFHQMAVPEVDEIDGLPPAAALQQQRGSPTTRSSVGSVTTLSNLLRMLYSRAGDYPRSQPLCTRSPFRLTRPALVPVGVIQLRQLVSISLEKRPSAVGSSRRTLVHCCRAETLREQ
jgi:hypothetical protein